MFASLHFAKVLNCLSCYNSLVKLITLIINSFCSVLCRKTSESRVCEGAIHKEK